MSQSVNQTVKFKDEQGQRQIGYCAGIARLATGQRQAAYTDQEEN